MFDPDLTYDSIQDFAVRGNLDAATEAARLLYNHLTAGGGVPARPPLPNSLSNHCRQDTAVPSTGYPGSLSGLAWLCKGINKFLGAA